MTSSAIVFCAIAASRVSTARRPIRLFGGAISTPPVIRSFFTKRSTTAPTIIEGSPLPLRVMASGATRYSGGESLFPKSHGAHLVAHVAQRALQRVNRKPMKVRIVRGKIITQRQKARAKRVCFSLGREFT